MPEARLSNPRKRRHSEQPTPQHVCKRRKPSPLNGSQYPPAFWDNLSKIHLTKRAVKELDRRNSRQTYLRPDRRITRRVFAELKKSSQPPKPPRANGGSARKICCRVDQLVGGGNPKLSTPSTSPTYPTS
ncbi:hypothetical protein K505DRAFT_327349 [Melanomma pulvis-pyrius CBS 109.77]|uniref:Uncharacterized protein n=1 Tax=Melanomma pulvis-pyrius CBS 109.77 TaxID=1314802 RepID=A0A6A6X2M5_9PLEO|nr:hypothetical protein K505DRAFT_327349 [Melanomma pulvis-pyrius CBS 109.77]